MGARICDFCSVRAGVLGGDPLPVWWPSALAVLGSPGYVDPHYLRSGFVTKNSSVYNFGVLLLELPTGICRDLRVQDNKETESSQSITAYQMLDTMPHHKPKCRRLGAHEWKLVLLYY